MSHARLPVNFQSGLATPVKEESVEPFDAELSGAVMEDEVADDITPFFLLICCVAIWNGFCFLPPLFGDLLELSACFPVL